MNDEEQYGIWLLEAQREVDAMLPDSPPIAPLPTEQQARYYLARYGERLRVEAEAQRNIANDPNYMNHQAQLCRNAAGQLVTVEALQLYAGRQSN